MYLMFILVVTVCFALLMLIICLVHYFYVQNIKSFTKNFYDMYRRRNVEIKKMVPDNRPTIYVSRPNTSLYYNKSDYTFKPQKNMEQVRYYPKEKDSYRIGLSKVLWFFLAIFGALLLVSLAFLALKIVRNALGDPLDASWLAFINVTSNWNILITLIFINIFFITWIVLNYKKRKLYFKLRPQYIYDLNQAEIQAEFEENIIRVN